MFPASSSCPGKGDKVSSPWWRTRLAGRAAFTKEQDPGRTAAQMTGPREDFRGFLVRWAGVEGRRRLLVRSPLQQSPAPRSSRPCQGLGAGGQGAFHPSWASVSQESSGEAHQPGLSGTARGPPPPSLPPFLLLGSCRTGSLVTMRGRFLVEAPVPAHPSPDAE